MSSYIPPEIYLEIILRVPLKSLKACKLVCKTWLSLISDPGFARLQLNVTIQRNKPNLMLKGFEKSLNNRTFFYTIRHDSLESLLSTDKFLDYAVKLDYPFEALRDSVELMCCRDGLVCLWFEVRKFFCLWNPATREYKIIPKQINDVVASALGYDHKSDDYKLLVGSGSSFEVFSLGSNTWKSIGDVPYEFNISQESGVLVNGDLHWLAQRKKHHSDVLISLDISNEIFKEMELPEKLSDSGHWVHSLGVLKGCLCLLADLDLDDHVQIWVMQNYGVGESWTKRYIVKNERIINGRFPRLMCCLKSGEILLGGDGLVVYDPKSGSVTEPMVSSLIQVCQKELYFESLVSLNSGTYM